MKLRYWRVVGYDHRLRYVAAVAVCLAGCAAAAACLGRPRAARGLTAATALAGLGTVALAQIWDAGAPSTFVSPWAWTGALVGVVVAWAVLFTGAVPRAAGVVPRWWWGMTAIVCTVVAFRIGQTQYGPGRTGRMGVVLLVYAAQPIVLILLAGPLLRALPQLFAGLGMLLVPAAPFLAYGWVDSATPGSVAYLVPALTAAAWAAIVAAVAVVVRLDPKGLS